MPFFHVVHRQQRYRGRLGRISDCDRGEEGVLATQVSYST